MEQLQRVKNGSELEQTQDESGTFQKSESDRMIAEARAEIVLAKQFPRQRQQAKSKIIESCRRHSFANQAYFDFPMGGNTVKGPSIRLLELIATEWGNLEYDWSELSRQRGTKHDPGYSECSAYAWDKETNTKAKKRFIVEHVDLSASERALTRPREIYNKVANFATRRMRTCIKSVIPADVVQDAMDVAQKTVAKGPGDRSKQEVIESMVQKFNSIGVTAQQLADYVGLDDIENAGGPDIVDFKGVWNVLQDDTNDYTRDDFFGSNADSSNSDKPSSLAQKYSPSNDDSGDSNEDGPPENQSDQPPETPDGNGPTEDQSTGPDEAPSGQPEERKPPTQAGAKNYPAGRTPERHRQRAKNEMQASQSTEDEQPDQPDAAITAPEATKRVFKNLQGELDVSEKAASQLMDWLAYHVDESPQWDGLDDDQKIDIAFKLEDSSTAQVVRRRLETALGNLWEPIFGLEDFEEVDKSCASMVKKARRYHQFLEKIS